MCVCVCASSLVVSASGSAKWLCSVPTLLCHRAAQERWQIKQKHSHARRTWDVWLHLDLSERQSERGGLARDIWGEDMSSLSHQGHPTLSGLQWLACYFNPPPTKKKKTHTHIYTHRKEIMLMQYVTFAKSRNVCVLRRLYSVCRRVNVW